MAAQIAKSGFPVFRFDRRGIGDSEGENRGFRKAGGDIRAALEAFRAIAPQIERIVAFGNCDAASALMLTRGEGCDALVLSNPWTIDGDDNDDTPTPDAIRSRYADKLKNPKEIRRLLRGGVDLGKLARGLLKAVRPDPPQSTLADEVRVGLAEYDGEVRFLLASSDRTAQMFEANWDVSDPRILRCEGAGHAYVEPHAQIWLRKQLLDALRI